MKRLVIASSGASGADFATKVLHHLPSSIEAHFIKTDHSDIVATKEQNITLHQNDDIAASIASGSFKVDAMMITPCSMNTLAKIACGIADNLVTRTASVMIKERRTLLLAPREMPFSAIALENMLKLSRLGVIVAPPVMAYYSNQESLEEMERFVIGKWFDLLGIENSLFTRWQ